MFGQVIEGGGMYFSAGKACGLGKRRSPLLTLYYSSSCRALQRWDVGETYSARCSEFRSAGSETSVAGT